MSLGSFDADRFPGGDLFDFNRDGELDPGEFALYSEVVFGDDDNAVNRDEDIDDDVCVRRKRRIYVDADEFDADDFDECDFDKDEFDEDDFDEFCDGEYGDSDCYDD